MAATRPHNTGVPGQTNPATDFQAITPDDDTDLDPRPRAIICSAAGNVSLDGDTQTAVVIAIDANVIYPFHAKRIRSTSTTATGIIGLY